MARLGVSLIAENATTSAIWGSGVPPTAAEVDEIAGPLRERKLLDQVRNLAREPSGRKDLERFVIHMLILGRRARERFEALRRGTARFAYMGQRVEDGGRLQRDLAARLRQLGKRARGALNPAIRKQVLVEATALREELVLQKGYDRLIRDVHLGKLQVDPSGRRPVLLYQKVCAEMLTGVFQLTTGKPHHGLAGMLMLSAGVFVGRLCQPWNPMLDSKGRCLNYLRRTCPQACRRAEDRVQYLVK